MNHSRATTSTVRYGRKLVTAGIAGIRNGQDAARGDRCLSDIAADASQHSVGPAVAGACLGLLASCLMRERNRVSKAFALGTVGSVLGFAVGFGWKTRNIASHVMRSTAKELRRARDEHWLELNPIDYA